MVSFDLFSARSARQRLGPQKAIVESLQSLGATSPERARSRSEMEVMHEEAWQRLVADGYILEGSPGRYYLAEVPQLSAPPSIVKMLIFWGLMILTPLALILALSN